MKLTSLLYEQFSPELFDALKSFVASNKTDKLEAAMPEIEKLIASHEYSEIIDPAGVVVYRGMKLFYDDAEKLCNGKNYTEETSKTGVIYRTFKGSGDIPTKRIIQSWSADPNVGIQFAVDPDVEGEIPVVFIAKATKGKFFGKPGILAKTVMPERASEMETISIGKVQHEGFVMAIPPKSFLGRDPHSVDIRKLKSLVLVFDKRSHET